MDVMLDFICMRAVDLSRARQKRKKYKMKMSCPQWDSKQKRSIEGCSKFKSPETRQVQERLVSTLEHMQVPKWDRTHNPEFSSLMLYRLS